MDSESQSARTAPATGAVRTDSVLVRVPADPDYLAVVRSASAQVATKFGCTLPEVADLRLAVDEACGLLLRHTVRDQPGAQAGSGPDAGADAGTGSEDLECRFVLDGPELRVTLSMPARDVAKPEEDEFGWTILSALVDDIVWRIEGPTAWVEILKRRSAGR